MSSLNVPEIKTISTFLALILLSLTIIISSFLINSPKSDYYCIYMNVLGILLVIYLLLVLFIMNKLAKIIKMDVTTLFDSNISRFSENQQEIKKLRKELKKEDIEQDKLLKTAKKSLELAEQINQYHVLTTKRMNADISKLFKINDALIKIVETESKPN